MNKKYLVIGLGVGILAITATSVALAASNNYASWRGTMGGNGGRAANVVTEKNFDQFSQMHQLMANGDYTGAQKIRTSLGMGQGRGNGQGAGCRMHNGGGRDANFVDANNNGVCDHMEQLTK
ncbi:MAG: hypothetical protein WCG01_04075 [bacterium]